MCEAEGVWVWVRVCWCDSGGEWWEGLCVRVRVCGWYQVRWVEK